MIGDIIYMYIIYMYPQRSLINMSHLCTALCVSLDDDVCEIKTAVINWNYENYGVTFGAIGSRRSIGCAGCRMDC